VVNRKRKRVPGSRRDLAERRRASAEKPKRGRPRKTSNLSQRTRYRREKEARDAILLAMLDRSAAGAAKVSNA
jgi:hypothetical protein